MKIVILPGLDGTCGLLSEFSDLLSENHEPLTFEYPTNLVKYEELQKWIEKRLPDGEYIIVAESFSGPLAVLVAASNPDELKGVVFVATFASTPRKVPLVLTYALEFLPIKSRLFLWLAHPLLMGGWSTSEFIDTFRHALKSVPKATLAGRLREVLAVDVRDRIATLTIPTTYFAATKDRLVSTKSSQVFRDHLSTIVTIDGPHFVLHANPTEAARKLSEFANSLS